jgi:hypothetical protein
MSPTPRLNPDFLWECAVCQRAYRRPEAAARCHPPAQGPPTAIAPLVRCAELAALEGHLLALTGWLEADQAELTLLHRKEDDGALKVTAYRFCASREGLEPTGAFAFIPA